MAFCWMFIMPVMEMRAVRHLTLCCLTKRYAVLPHTRNACEQEEQNHTVWAVSLSLRVWYSLFQRIHIINIYVFVAINSFFKTTSTDKTYLLVFKFCDTLNLLYFLMDFID